MKNSLEQLSIARECASWIRDKVKIKEVKTQGAIPFNLYHIDSTNESIAIQV